MVVIHCTNLVTFTEEIPNGKLYFLRSYTATFSQFSSTTVKIYFIGGRLGSGLELQAFQGFSLKLDDFQILSRSVTRIAAPEFTL